MSMNTNLNDDQKWQAVLAHDPQMDGQFFYAVKTTGVYCYPSCGARPPLRKNVAFYPTAQAAEQAGFRACKRCKPDQPPKAQLHGEAVAKACRLIEEAEEAPKLEDLARSANMSPHHFHRIFKKIIGLTPKAYATQHRAQKIRTELERSDTVTEAIYDAGFNSNGRFYANAQNTLGMTPTQYRAGGKGEVIKFAIGQSHLGAILVAASEKGICAILLDDDPDFLIKDVQRRFKNARLCGGDEDFEKWVAQIIGFIETPQIGLDLPLDMRGTIFQKRVWQALRDIKVGTTVSYSEIAQKIGAPKAVRAVASACAANKLAIAIPCHRVVRTDGTLSGYRWGLARKRQLLDAEAQI